MKLKSLELTNFRSHAATQLSPLEKLTCIRGSLNQGKSSLEMAIEVALTGRCEVTDDKGEGQRSLIRQGATEGARVRLELEEGERAIELLCTINEKSGRSVYLKSEDPGWDPTPLQNFFRRNRDILDCVCNSRYFLSRDEKEQKRILASVILPAEMTFENDDEREDWTAAQQACHTLGLQVPWNAAPFDAIEAAYDAAFKARTNTNRDIKNFQMPVEPRKDVLNIDQARANQTRAMTELVHAKNQRGEFLKDWEQREARRRQVTGEVERLRTRRSMLQQELDKFEADRLSDDTLKKYKKTAALKAEADKLNYEIEELARIIAKTTAEQRELNQVGKDSTCPHCHQKIDQAAIEAMANDLYERNNEAVDAHVRAVAKRKELGDYEAAAAKVAAHNEAGKDIKRLQASLKEVDDEISRLEFDCPAAEDRPATTEQDATISQREADYDAATGDLVEATKAEQQAAARERARIHRAELGKRLSTLEQLITYFGPKGIKATLLDRHVGAFLAKVNSILAIWEYCVFMEHDTLRFEIAAPNIQKPLPLNQLSKSEQYRFAIALQVALSHVAEIGFVVVDESEILPAEFRGELLEALMDSDVIEQIILIGTDQRKEVAEFPGYVVYYLENTGEGTQVEQLKEEALHVA